MKAVTYKRPGDSIGGSTVIALNQWITNGLKLRGGKDDLGFMFMYEMMTGKGERALNVRIMQGDSNYNLACLMLRLLPPKDHQKKHDILMSILRVLARNQALSADPSIPQAEQAKKGFMASLMVKGMDNIFSKLLKDIVPWLEKHKGELDWHHADFDKALNYPSDLTLMSPGALPRALLTPQISDFACPQRDWHVVPQITHKGVQIGATAADLKTASTYPLNAIGLSNFVQAQKRADQVCDPIGC